MLFSVPTGLCKNCFERDQVKSQTDSYYYANIKAKQKKKKKRKQNPFLFQTDKG